MIGADDMPLTRKSIREEYDKLRYLGQGAEGKVSLWRHRRLDKFVAIKEPTRGMDAIRAQLHKEIENLRLLGTHPNIVTLLGWDEYWIPLAPALFLDYCDLGDAGAYRKQLFKIHQDIPEETIWKLILDMSAGLDHIHNKLRFPYVHGDFKITNILVSRPPDCLDPSTIPILPTFKIADIARLVPYTPGCGPDRKFYGTPEYGPPRSERAERITPAVDIYGLGATVQEFAYGLLPTMTIEKFKQEFYLANNKTVKELKEKYDWWREFIPVVHRPLNVPEDAQVEKWDVKYPISPYSDELNSWYSMCLEEKKDRRVSAEILTKWFIPLAEGQISVLTAEREMILSSAKAEDAWNEYDMMKAGDSSVPDLPQRGPLNASHHPIFSHRSSSAPPKTPSYQGNDYAPLSFVHGSDVPGENTHARERQAQLPAQGPAQVLAPLPPPLPPREKAPEEELDEQMQTMQLFDKQLDFMKGLCRK